MAHLFVPQGVNQAGYLLSVGMDGTNGAVTFGTAFSNIKLASGDYHLDIHCYDSLTEASKTEFGFTSQKTATGFTVFPGETAAYVTWEAVPLTEGLSISTIPTIIDDVTEGVPPQGGVAISPAGAPVAVVFTDDYASTDYNVIYRAYLTATPTSGVSVSVTKSVSGLTFTPPGSVVGQSVTVEWNIGARTQ